MRALEPKLPLPDGLSVEYLKNYRLLPIEIVEGKLRVAAYGEPDAQALDDLDLLFSHPVEAFQVEEADLFDAIRRVEDASVSVVEISETDGSFAPELSGPSLDESADARDLANQPPVIRYVNMLLRDAHEAGASDVHLEGHKDGLSVRFRIDGVLSGTVAPPGGMQHAIASRLKLLAGLDISERRVPQDGRIKLRLEHRDLDVRVSTMPSFYGESLVLRLLDPGAGPVALEALGMDPGMLHRFGRLVAAPNGIVLVTGPTGSGKTTTLYAALGLRDAAAEKIVTVEDPVEYALSEVVQVTVNSKAGLTFARVLRSVLRQDPDVLLVGEMRDEETANVAVRAAMTGHLVLSTLHTNDAASAVGRLLDLGVEEYLISSTLEAVLGQRLVRKVCSECRESYEPDPQAVSLLSRKPVRKQKLFRGVGCDACRHTGFKGRTGIFELLVLEDEIRDRVARGATRSEVRAVAHDKGMQTMLQDGWTKVQAGITTVEEVLRVTNV